MDYVQNICLHLFPLMLVILQPIISEMRPIINYMLNTNLSCNSFLPSDVRDWNELSQDTNNATSICPSEDSPLP